MEIDPITLEVIRNAFVGIAEEMSTVLIRTAYSPNIKERRDCSSALFDSCGRMIAQAENLPVHLGAMPFSVAAALEQFKELHPGDVIILNDPFYGGAHLPDITLITPIFYQDRFIALAANRAHHADVGGATPGSLSGEAREIYQEGLRVPPLKLWEAGKLNEAIMALIRINVRTPLEREGDIRAQMAANETGRRRFIELIERYGKETTTGAAEAILDYSERRMRGEIRKLGEGVYRREDYLDDDGVSDERVKIKATVTVEKGDLIVDFSGSSPQVSGPVNAVYAVTASATYYAIRCMTDPEIPPNHGCYRPIEILAPPGTVVNALPPAAVAGGNLETSQRIVDILIRALAEVAPARAAAGSQGTMNNITFGGTHNGRSYTFYETIGGGSGACSPRDGADGIHTHMTNTMNTPIEVIESTYPLRIERYELRPDSGGAGRFRGGLGLRRDIRVLKPSSFTILADRRKGAPYGLDGGRGGERGEDLLIIDGKEVPIKSKHSLNLDSGTVVSIRTPGGGGYGDPKKREGSAVLKDLREGKITLD